MKKDIEEWWCSERDVEISKKMKGQDVSDGIYNRDSSGRNAIKEALARLARVARHVPEDQQAEVFTRENLMPLFEAILSPDPPSFDREAMPGDVDEEARQRRLVPIYYELWIFLRQNSMRIAKDAHSLVMDVHGLASEGDVELAQAALAMEYHKIREREPTPFPPKPTKLARKRGT